MSKMNRFTKASYDQLKNSAYTLVSFNEKGHRIKTYGNLSVDRLIKELSERTGISIVFDEGELSCFESIERNIDFFYSKKESILKAQREKHNEQDTR